MKRPSFQFYPGDWQGSQKLRRCSPAARGAWLDILCVLHDCDEYGVARYPLRELCRAAGVELKHARELVDKGVLKGSDSEPVRFAWAPSHAGRKGTETVLVESAGGPCWYCSRFVEDEYKRGVRGQQTRFDDSTNQPKRAPKPAPKYPPKGGIGDGEGDAEGYGVGDGEGDGPSSSSSSSTTPDRQSRSESLPTRERSTDQPTTAGLACRLMRDAGCTDTNPSHPNLLAALGEGVTPEALADTAREAITAGKQRPFAYAIATARSRHAEAATTNTPGASHAAHRAVHRPSLADQCAALDLGGAGGRPEPPAGVIDGEAVRVAG